MRLYMKQMYTLVESIRGIDIILEKTNHTECQTVSDPCQLDKLKSRRLSNKKTLFSGDTNLNPFDIIKSLNHYSTGNYINWDLVGRQK